MDELRTIASNGLRYCDNPYDQERYDRLLELAARAYGDVLELPTPAVRECLSAELGHVTPKVGADAAIFDAEGRILLMDRADGSGWCLPCGFVEPNERPCDAAVRETREETGLEVRVLRLVGVFTGLPSLEHGRLHTVVGIVHLCEVTGGQLRLSHEGLALQYWSVEEVPRWYGIHRRYAAAALAQWRSPGALPAVFE
ncbi:MAG: NUDIX hydrolase N-terminal domain-containing protein [Nannocystaceae bacterium]